MNKALTPANKRRILRRMKSNFFSEVKKRKMTLFGILSPTLKSILKMQTWLEVRNQLVAAGFPPRNNLKRNGRACRQPLNPNTPNERRLGVVQ